MGWIEILLIKVDRIKFINWSDKYYDIKIQR